MFSYIIIAVIHWDALPRNRCIDLYNHIAKNIDKLENYIDKRKCEKYNNCNCQGSNIDTQGASYTFGCTYSIYHDTCKYALSGMDANLKRPHEKKIHEVFHNIRACLL